MPALKPMVTRASFASLDNVLDWSEHCAFVDRHVAAGNREVLKEIFLELNEGSRIPVGAAGGVVERIITALALTEGYDNAVTALELAGIADDKPNAVRWRARAAISKIVAAQSREVIDALLRNVSDLEVTGLVLHEAVLRRKLVEDSSVVPEIQRRLAEAQHPLAWLPLTLLDVEQDVLLPHYTTGCTSWSVPFGPSNERRYVNPGRPLDIVEATETTCPERAALISTAVLNWKDHSNGKIEARTFRVNLLTRDTLPLLLLKLGLESIGTEGIPVRENAVVKDAFTLLFSAVSSGGAYSGGNLAAYGRLLAWRSLAGLVGASLDVPVHDLAATAHACHWCLFDSPTEWYYQVAWDIGIACFNPARQELAVLAATDTD